MEKTPEQLAEELNAKVDNFKTELKEAKENAATKEQLEELTTKLQKATKDLEEANKSLEKQGDEINILLSKEQEQSIKDYSMNLAVSLEKQFKENEEEVEKFINKQTGKIEFAVKAPASMFTSGISPNATNVATTSVMPGLTDIARVKPTLLDYVPAPTIDSYVIQYHEKKTPEGAAAVVAEGALKPQTDFNITSTTTTAVEIAAIANVSRQMLRDVRWIASEIEKEIVYQIRKQIQTQIATKITASAAAFTATGIVTTTPNNYDAIEAAVTQMDTVFADPTLVRVHPIDKANMNMAKGANGHYVFPQFLSGTGREISGLPVVTDNNLTQGTFSVIDVRMFNFYIHEGMTIRFSEHNNDNFEKNMVTMRGELSVHMFIKSNEEVGFFQDTFANVKAGIV